MVEGVDEGAAIDAADAGTVEAAEFGVMVSFPTSLNSMPVPTVQPTAVFDAALVSRAAPRPCVWAKLPVNWALYLTFVAATPPVR